MAIICRKPVVRELALFDQKGTPLSCADMHMEMSEDESRFLVELLRERSPRKILEIGCAAGGTTALILKMLSPRQRLYSVDTSARYYRDKNRNTGYVVDELCTPEEKSRHTTFYGKDIIQCIDAVGGGIDFVILDTTHVLPGELLTFFAVLPFLSDGACVALHDLALNMFPFNEKNYQARKNAYCTKILFSTVSSQKKILIDGARANIGAFFIDETTRSNVESLFLALGYSWIYYPESLLPAYEEFIREKYSPFCHSYFQQCLAFQKALVNAGAKESAPAPSGSSGITREHIVWAYRLFLGREPENDDVVSAKLGTLATLPQLQASFLSSEEFINGKNIEYKKDIVRNVIRGNEANVVFLHIQKTFGTSFANFLLKLFPETFIDLKKFLDAPVPRSLNRKRVFGGHVDFSFYSDMIAPAKTLFLSVVRHPIERAYSWHNFHKDEYWKGRDYSLKEAFLRKNEHAVSNCFSNAQCRILTGKSTFEEAKSVIEKNNFIIGCFAFPDAFMQKCRDVLACEEIPLERMNVATTPSYMETYNADTELTDILYEYNMEDVKLYNYVKERTYLVNTIADMSAFSRERLNAEA